MASIAARDLPVKLLQCFPVKLHNKISGVINLLCVCVVLILDGYCAQALSWVRGTESATLLDISKQLWIRGQARRIARRIWDPRRAHGRF